MYREAPSTVELACPRCKKKLPPADVARCTCGVWLSSFAAGVLLTDAERAPDPVTRWWRKREPCPHCNEQMVLYNPDSDPGHFQGCEGHGYWIDADAVPHTSIKKGIDTAALARTRDDEAAMDAERERRFEAERERDERRREKEAAEHRLAKELGGRVADPQQPEIERGERARLREEAANADRERQREYERVRRLDEERAMLAAAREASLEPRALRESIEALEARILKLEYDKETQAIQIRRLADRLHALENPKDE